MTDEVRTQTIFGWVGIQETSKGDMLVHLYDSNPGLKWAIAQVYEEDFGKLPQHLQADIKKVLDAEGVDTKAEGAPTREKAESSGVMRHINPEFEVPVRNKRIVWEQAGELSAGKQASGPGRFVWTEPLTPEQWEITGKVASDVAGLQWQLANQIMEALIESEGIEENQVTFDMYLDMIPEVHRGASYEFGRLWKQAVQSEARPSQGDFGLLDGAAMAIEQADPDKFFDVLAEHHPLIIDGDHGKIILKAVGETGLKPDAGDRVVQAQKAWLFVDLTGRHNRDKGIAKKVVDELYDQIAF